MSNILGRYFKPHQRLSYYLLAIIVFFIINNYNLNKSWGGTGYFTEVSKDNREITMPVDRNEIISAQVMLRPASGVEISPDAQITSKNLHEFAPHPNAYRTASDTFRSLDFETGPLVGVSFSITASVDTFIRVFKADLQRNSKGGIESKGGELILPLNHIPENARKTIQVVTFIEPPDFGPTGFME
jgi:hypothetical protein